MSYPSEYLVWALFIGALSAVSLPIGSIAGLIIRPRESLTAVLTAFGAGALLAAFTVELVAPTVEAVVIEEHNNGGALIEFAAMIAGAVLGGVLFVVLDGLINKKGGFLRKHATAIAWFSADKKKRQARIIEDLGNVPLLHHIPSEHIHALVDCVEPIEFKTGEYLFHEGDTGDRLFFIRSGRVELIRDGIFFKELDSGDVLGELALLTGAPRTADARAGEPVKALALKKEDFDRIRASCSELDEAVRNIAGDRVEELGRLSEARMHKALEWIDKASQALRRGAEVPTPDDVRRIGRDHGGGTLGIWLGMLLDAVPDGLVIGTGFLAALSLHASTGNEFSIWQAVPYTLIAGLALSNFPEAMSGSVMMQNQGLRPGKIIFMWMTILIVTMAGSLIGFMAGEALPPVIVVGVEGLAAGSILTMITSTMIPEAVHLGAPDSVGLASLAGFLSALAFKLLE